MDVKLTISNILVVSALAITQGGRSSPASAEPAPKRPLPTPTVAPVPTLIPKPVLLENPCRDLPTANRTERLRGVGVELFSTGPLGGEGCNAFVADIEVDAQSVASNPQYLPEIQLDSRDTVREGFLNHYKDNGNFAKYAKISQAECTAHKHSLHVYRKLAGQNAFTLVGGGPLTTSWNAQGLGFGPVCMINPGPTFKPLPKIVPPTQGTDVYRMVVTIANPPGQVSVWVQHVKK